MKRLICIFLVLLFAVPVLSVQRLPTNRATILAVGPFVDYSDGVSPETAMTVTNITCELYKMSDAGGAGTAPTRTAITLAASGTANDMVHITNDAGGYYSIELTAAQLNFVGRAKLCFTDPDVMAPVWEDLIVEPNNVYDSDVSGTDKRETDAVSFSGDTTAADNAELMFDGTGYAGGTTKLGVDAVAMSGSTTAADNLETVFATDFATSYDGTVDRWNVDVESFGGTAYGTALADPADIWSAATRTLTGAQTFNLTGNISGSVGSVAGNVDGSVASVTTVSDKTGYSLAADQSAVTVGTVTNVTNAATNGDLTAAMKASVTAAVPTATAVVTAMGTGTFLTAVPWNAAWDAEVQSEAAAALTAYGPATATALATAQADLDNPSQYKATGFSTHSAADVVTAMGTGTFLSGVPWNVTWATEAQAAAAAALTAYGPATADAVATAVLAEDIDGQSVQSVLEALLSFLAGKIAVTDDATTRTFTYYLQDGTTAKMVITATKPLGNRTATGAVTE